MGLIRNAAASTLARDAVVLDLGDLQRQGERLKQRARAEAERIAAEGRAERARLVASAAEEGRRQGLVEGHKQGLEEGRAEGKAAALAERRAELDGLVSGWTAALDEFNARRERMLAEARLDVLKLALTIAERITRRIAASDPLVVAEQIRAVLAAVARPTRLSLAVHPDDIDVAREVMPEVEGAMGEHSELAADPALSRGSCIARTGEGAQIDASIDTQLQRVIDALLPGRGLGGAPQQSPDGAPGQEGSATGDKP